MFTYNNVNFQKMPGSDIVMLKADVYNDVRKDFNTVALKVNLYSGVVMVWTGIVKIRNFKRKQTRPIEIMLEGIKAPTVEGVTKCDIVFESGY